MLRDLRSEVVDAPRKVAGHGTSYEVSPAATELWTPTELPGGPKCAERSADTDGRLTMVMRIEARRAVAHVAAEMRICRPTAYR